MKTISIDDSSLYPTDNCALIGSFFVFSSFYKCPLGVIKSALRKNNIPFKMEDCIEKGEIVKVLSSSNGHFFFRKGGKNKSWLCYRMM